MRDHSQNFIRHQTQTRNYCNSMYSLIILVAFLFLLKESDAQFWHGRNGGGNMVGGRQRGRRGGNMGGGRYGGGNMGGGGYGGGNMGGGRYGGGDDTGTTTSPQDTIHELIQNRDSITRDVENTEKGVKTFTSGASDQINTWIARHVEEMKALVESGGRIRNWDPLFQELFQYADQHHLECTQENNGLACEHKGDNACAIGLAQAHAAVVSLFLENGRDEVMDSHEDYIPDSCKE
jgi:hypothetical protein